MHWLIKSGGPPDDIDMASVHGSASVDRPRLANGVRRAAGGTRDLLHALRPEFLVKRDWAAAVVAALVLGLREGLGRTSQSLALDAALIVVIYAVLAFVLLRMGMVPAILCIFVVNMSGAIPIAADFGSWMNPVAVTYSAADRLDRAVRILAIAIVRRPQAGGDLCYPAGVASSTNVCPSSAFNCPHAA